MDVPQGVHFLLALCLRDVDDALVAPRAAHVGEPDAGVARRSLHDGAAGLEGALFFGVGDEVLGGAVLHGAPRVHPLGLGEDLAPGFVAQASKPHQRGVAGVRDCLRIVGQGEGE